MTGHQDDVSAEPPTVAAPVVFVSYAHADKVSALAIDQWLRNRSARVLIDERDFLAGQDIEQEIVRCVRAAGKVVCLYSKSSASGPYVELERRIAMVLERESGVRRLIYFCLDDTALPDEAQPRLAILARDLSFEAAMNDLWRSVVGGAGEPREVDLRRYRDTPPWHQAPEQLAYRRTAEEVPQLHKRLVEREMTGADRVQVIEWISEGSEKVVRGIFEEMTLDSNRFSQAERLAAKLALDDLNSACRSTNLLERVSADEWNAPEGGGPVLGVIVKALFWDRPGTQIYSTAVDAFGKLLSGGPPEGQGSA